jgi:putative ABC transport system ATP-binding protein
MAAGPVIEISGVEHVYAAQHAHPFVLRIPEVRVEPGEVVACIGPSGCGKTTMLHLIAGVLAPAKGCIRVLGHEFTAMTDAARRRVRLERIGMVFQEFELLEYLTAAENITLATRVLRGCDPAALRAHAAQLAACAGISHTLARKPRKLSQGERQRVALCRALATKPSLVLCDEPTGNLDPESTSRILGLLIDRARTSGTTVLTVTHNQSAEVLDRFDRVLDLRLISRTESSAYAGNAAAIRPDSAALIEEATR